MNLQRNKQKRVSVTGTLFVYLPNLGTFLCRYCTCQEMQKNRQDNPAVFCLEANIGISAAFQVFDVIQSGCVECLIIIRIYKSFFVPVKRGNRHVYFRGNLIVRHAVKHIYNVRICICLIFIFGIRKPAAAPGVGSCCGSVFLRIN